MIHSIESIFKITIYKYNNNEPWATHAHGLQMVHVFVIIDIKISKKLTNII